MSRRLRTREKLTLLDPPNPQWSSFRTNCEPYSVSPAPILAPHEFSSRKHHHRNPRQICTCKIKGFNPPVMNTSLKSGRGRSSVMLCKFVAAAFRRAPTPTEKPGNPPETNTCQVKRRNSRVMNTCRKIGALWGAQKSTLFREKATHRMRFSRQAESSFCALTKSGYPSRFLAGLTPPLGL